MAANKYNTAILIATPSSTCSLTRLTLILSANFVSISTPLFIGPGCITKASLLAYFNFSGVKSLYPQKFGFAWTGSSATLYDLLVLNHRFQSSSVDLSKNDPNQLKIDLKVINALERGVGYGFGYQNLLSVEELENTD